MKKIEYLEMMNDLFESVSEKACKACTTSHYEPGAYCLACEQDMYDHMGDGLTDDDIAKFFYANTQGE